MKTHTEYIAHVKEVIAKVRVAIDQLGLTAEDLGFTNGHAPRGRRAGKKVAEPAPRRKKQKSVIRFKGPNGETWSGRGSTPRWITDSGKDKEAFRVKD